MDQQSGPKADAHYQGGPWRGEGNSYQRSGVRGRGYDGGGSRGRGYDGGGNRGRGYDGGGSRGRGYDGGGSRGRGYDGGGSTGRGYNGGGSTGRGNRQYNRDNDRQGYQWNNKQYNQEERPQSGGFGKPSYQQRSNVQQQEDMTQGQNNFNDRARPKDKNYEDHVRDTSPDRQDRSRPKDKNDEDHTRDPSPDRSLPEHCIQENVGSSFDATTSNQSPQVQNTGASSSQGMSKPQQSFDSQNMEWNAQGQGKGQDYRHQHSNRGRGQQHNENWEDTQGQGRDHQNQQYNRNRDDYQNYDRHQQYQRYDDQRGGYGRGKRNQGYSDNKDGYQQGQGYNRRDYQQNDDRRQQRSGGEKSDFHLSKAMSFILRHGAEKQGYKMMPGGFLYVEEILKRQNNLRDYNLEDVKRIVETNDKKRFHMEPDKETGKMKIRANQGHSIEVQDLELKPLLSAKEVSMVIHGTYYNSWEKIKNTGLSRMNRNHIHFAAGEPGENGVISGMRQSCEVMIFINLEAALKDGFKFFRSANNVILCAGNEDGVIPPKYFLEAVQRNPRQRLGFDENVKVVKVPIGGANLVQDGKGKKKKNKKNKGDREKEEGTETQKKKDKTEIDETAMEDTAQMFNEKMEVDSPSGSNTNAVNVDVSKKSKALNVNATSGSGALSKIKDDYPTTPPNSWEDDEKFEDAVQDQEPEDEYVDAQVAVEPQVAVDGFGPDVIVESSEEILTIDEPENSVSAVDYLMEKDVVAVHVDLSKDGIQRITCVTEDKSYIFEVENNPYLMTSGKVAEFFNWTPDQRGPTKVFHGLDSKTCAVFFDKYDIILDGTKIYDLKIAYDMMKEGGFGDLTKLKKTGFSPDCITVKKDNVTAVCLPYLKAYQYFSKEVSKNMKDYKKYLFEMVKADIDVEKMKKLREKKKKDLKAAANQVQNTAQAQPKKSKKKKT